ncbi:DUF819 family protein [uncultured Sunxiuqinia sp.]|uniref:DUF819 family protein n=1 Tax=uncultured Sunxiuqinia sp. TaxID=1573825 RepID=UPI0030DB2264|tara:strand:+ start:6947 stop:8215 length:1269 start_codon:yes stop_codon:yes gene_type:complete
MIPGIVLIIFYFAFPILLIYLTHISKFLNKVGVVVLAYIIGMLLGNIGLFPSQSESFRALLESKSSLPQEQAIAYFSQGLITENDLLANHIASLQDLIITLVIPIAIPLLLFSLDIRRWLKLAKQALFSLLLAMVSLLIVIFAGFFLFETYIPETWKISGMLVGIYTGGTPNLAAISTALDVNPNIFILTHTYDLMLGAICLAFLMTVAQQLFNSFLPSFREAPRLALAKVTVKTNSVDSYVGMLTRKRAIQLMKAFGFSVLIFSIAGGLSLLVPPSAQMVAVILSITTLGLVFSTIKSIHRIEKTFQLGMYFIIVFSLVIASMSDLRSMFQIEFLNLFLYVALAVFGSMAIHVFLSWIFKVDSDTTIITITALTFSPPFVPVVAGALKNKELIISGLTVGILGYAFGNYVGVAIAFFLKGF